MYGFVLDTPQGDSTAPAVHATVEIGDVPVMGYITGLLRTLLYFLSKIDNSREMVRITV
jgi:hypothetical protein